MKYAIVDIETTGRTQRITEIAIVRYEDDQKIDEYVQLVNPEQNLPVFIQHLTGITDEMLYNQPTFSEIAEEVFNRLDSCIFVAHHVNFDLPIVIKHLAASGIKFRPKKLCTVRLARKLMPGKSSYSLGKLCKDLNIEINGRHRALGDALATGKVWELFFKNPQHEEVFNLALNPVKGLASLPANLPLKDFQKLPEKPGIYYFLNKNNEILYIGKAVNLKNRVLSHFRSKSKSKITMCRETTHINFEETGSEFLALIVENIAIKKNWPKYNRALKKFSPRLGLTFYKNRKGILQLGYNQIRLISNPLAEFYSEGECIKCLTELCLDFQLCPKYCQLVGVNAKCKDYYLHIPCDYCQEKIGIKEYNERVLKAIESFEIEKADEIIKLPGRNKNEDAFIYLENKLFRGYGFVENDVEINHIDDLEPFLINHKSNPEIQGIIRRFHTNNIKTMKVETA